jgi:hypothetical protein
MTHTILDVIAPGEAESFAYPALNTDLTIKWDALDGTIIGPILASAVGVKQFDAGKNVFVEVASVPDVRINCYITEARIALVCPKYDKGGGWVGGFAVALNAGSKLLAARRRHGTALTGHIRYPWVKGIYFQPKQGFRSVESLRIVYESDGSVLYLTLILDKSTDSSALAFGLMERVVAYRQADTDTFGEVESQAFDALLAAGKVDNREKTGRLAGYQIPTNWPAPGGEQCAPAKPPSKSVASAARGAAVGRNRLHDELGG